MEQTSVVFVCVCTCNNLDFVIMKIFKYAPRQRIIKQPPMYHHLYLTSIEILPHLLYYHFILFSCSQVFERESQALHLF